MTTSGSAANDAGMHIRPGQAADAARIARLHVDVFAGHTLALLGPRFLELYYLSVLESPAAIVWCAEDAGALIGFVAGMVDARGFYRSLLLRRGALFALAGLQGVARHPRLAARLLRGLTFHREHAAPPRTANLSSIGVAESYRGRGVARRLIAAFCDRARDIGANQVILGVDPDETDVVALYKSVGFVMLEAGAMDIAKRSERRNLELRLRDR